MAVKIVMPKLGLTMKEGTVSKWLKQEGESVKKGEPLFEVSTDKINNEIESPGNGILRKIVAPAEAKVPVSALLGIIAEADENISDIETEMPANQQKPDKKAVPAAKPAAAARRSDDKIRVSPVAKKLAEEKGIPLENIEGTGPKGRITKEDVENYQLPVSDEVQEQDGDIQGVPLEGLREVIAERLQESWQQAPHVTITREVDVSALKALKEKIKNDRNQKVSFTDLLAILTTKALQKHPDLNAQFADGLLYRHQGVHLGIAVALENGLMVPVVKNADRKSISEIHDEMRELAQKAKFNRLESDELSGATFTITNLGMEGVDVFTPIINPPECAILGVGRMVDKPVFVGDELLRRPMMWLSLSFDHRIVDGQAAARFMTTLNQSIEEPGMALV
ncbi:dihydrolipoamide acetyltransferase family protein [Tindallia californiensis]|uniref:Dihydrolipoamide acetyltransferase component of pyruvate dehydrogenase complex n=1 Tax=Tindallia californiensis TaxID=159292 RepID=A0A1H3J273_9FIRM|nr:dihydrolipoamide acetyltransferase family protein [Tindallia californiensis]SDY33274.1 pyruvate dehydrogenase E2 component (dihydrolipoamide acetyltransferase) [Tindallia californiensis]